MMNEKVRTQVTLSRKTVDLIDGYAAERGVSRQDIIVEAIRDFLDVIYEEEDNE